MQMYMTLANSANCSSEGEPPGCVSPADVCHAALDRVDNFTAEVMQLVQSWSLRGVMLDWYVVRVDRRCRVDSPNKMSLGRKVPF